MPLRPGRRRQRPGVWPGSLADPLQRQARDPALRRSMGQHNRAEALKYDWQNVATQVREEYLMALTSPAGDQPISARAWVAGRGLLPSTQAQSVPSPNSQAGALAGAPMSNVSNVSSASNVPAVSSVLDEALRARAVSQ